MIFLVQIVAHCTHLSQSITRVEQSQLVPLQTLDVLHHEREVGHGLEAQLGLQGVQHVLQELMIRVSCLDHKNGFL